MKYCLNTKKLEGDSDSNKSNRALAAINGGLNGFMPKSLSNDQVAVALRDIIEGRIRIARAAGR